jgi:hypothetical protein
MTAEHRPDVSREARSRHPCRGRELGRRERLWPANLPPFTLKIKRSIAPLYFTHETAMHIVVIRDMSKQGVSVSTTQSENNRDYWRSVDLYEICLTLRLTNPVADGGLDSIVDNFMRLTFKLICDEKMTSEDFTALAGCMSDILENPHGFPPKVVEGVYELRGRNYLTQFEG